MFHFILLVFSFLLFPNCNTQEGVIKGYVVRILDGDTFEILLEDTTTVKVRMNGIDAPEKGMDYGQVSKQYLSSLIFNKQVKMVKYGEDRYKRWLCDVFADNEFVNLQMIQAGLAWHYKKYSKESELADAEILARQNKLGLWAVPNPVAPWEWRKNK